MSARAPHPIEERITHLVQIAPVIDGDVVAALVRDLEADGRPLALSIARVVARVGVDIDPAISLPALAMACGTLVDARLTDREREAARFEIDTLLPPPETARRPPPLTAPDVPLAALSRGPRPRT